jgi:type IV secretion system protein VirB9
MNNKPFVGLCLAGTVLGGCAGGEKEIAGAFQPARLAPPAAPSTATPAAPATVPAPVPLALADQPLPAPLKARADRRPPTSRVEAANRDALREPSSAGYVNAVQVYPFAEGAVYRLYAAPERVSDIALEPGETLVAVAAGDTLRWIIGDTTSGAGAARRTHILVKPSAPGLATNLVITTDRRSYHLQLDSTAKTAMAAISWTYPQDQLIALDRSGPASAPQGPQTLAVGDLRFRYTISGDRPPWRPLRAFDDGRQVFIEFPESLGQSEAPPLFVLGREGGVELVNYRIQGNHYVVDKLFEAAELRLGKTKQQVVRIRREDAVLPGKRRAS